MTTTTTSPSEGGQDAQEFLGAQYVNALFARHAVAKVERSNLAAKLLGHSYHSAHRRMRGFAPWTIDELAKLAAHFGERIQDLFLANDPAARDAFFDVGGFRAPCQIWLASTDAPKAPGQIVARQLGSEWIVSPATQDTLAESRAVRTIVMQPLQPAPKRIAVVDDDKELSEHIAAYLNAMGFDARPFLSAAGLAKEPPFDAYVVDWLLGSGTARDMLASIRASDKSCPIVVLTGQIDSGKASPADVADAMAVFGLQYFTKPVEMPMLAATLSRMLEGAASRPGG